jgi:enoyl-[acyl-carrier-protein] reductase (NADH)
LRTFFKTEAARLGQSEEDVYQRLASRSVLRHIATSDEVAQAVLFFAGPMSTAITGQSLDVNCGEWFG